ncbi:MAG TPA: sensor histidine kinase [Actinophytocola sp.]|uniref:sensor histidine kinase n=1 Tax=Actinophytocola sp. TaxID=1872138 RepID=UPI002DB956E2|nr:sensor histidine kinase [Actinophytocola sp.]HEU5472477.1 sensor histidine kinase [Actinophytocola sp.]
MVEVVRSVWREGRPAGAPGVRGWDWGLVAVVVVAALVEVGVRDDIVAPGWSLGVTLALVPLLLWRRVQPLVVVAVGFGICAVVPLIVGDEVGLNAMAFMVVLPYALSRWGSGREVVIGSAVMMGKLGVSLGAGTMTVGETAGGVLVLAAAGAVGAAVRYRARARGRELDQVKLLERERLARDLHDTVAHHVSAMAIRAQAGLATMGAEPGAAADALRVIEGEASRTLAEMRTMVRALRRDLPAELAPTLGIGDLARLADRGGQGPVVDIEVVGEVGEVPPAIGAAIYRLAQESVTNARRHARHATRIEVQVLADDTSVHLRVSDDGDAATSGSPGYGLIGMIERADLLGGSCTAGPNPGRGWTVTAVLPRAT